MRQIVVVLHNIRSTYNVGAILRTAEGLGIEKVVYSGYTPRYNNPELLPHLRTKLDHQIAKSALGAEELVKQEILGPNLLTNWLKCAIMEGYNVVGLENNLSSEEMPQRLILGQPTKLKEKVVLVLGEEVSGIPPDIRPLVEHFLEIPMRGQKESFNVSVAAGIALWGLQELL